MAMPFNRPVQAFIYTLISGLSLPIAAVFGIKLSPVDGPTCSAMLAFGAGSLLFAVTVELYAHALHKVAHGMLGFEEILMMFLAAVCGAAFYLYCNRRLDLALSDDNPEENVKVVENSEPTRVVGSMREGRAFMFAEREAMARSMPALTGGRRDLAQQKSSSTRILLPCKKDDLQFARGRNKALMQLHQVAGQRTLDVESGLRTESHADEVAAKSGYKVAIALFVGLLIDGVPEGILMGFLAAEGHISLVLTISLFIANFPEAFSSSSLMIQSFTPVKIVALWTSLMLIVASLAGISCWTLLSFYPSFHAGANLPFAVMAGISVIEGFTGGAMIACIATVMLPEAFERGDKNGPLWKASGFLCTCGFLTSGFLKATFAHMHIE